jgi:uncharacterized protein
VTSPVPFGGGVAASTDLTHEECLELLAGAEIGRIVVTDGALPAAHPVAYVLDGEEVVFRTASGSKLAAAARHKIVAFEVDQIDVGARAGWSVLGVGEADEIVDPARLADLDGRLPDPWVPTAAAHVLTIPLQRLSGRRLSRGGPAPRNPMSLRLAWGSGAEAVDLEAAGYPDDAGLIFAGGEVAGLLGGSGAGPVGAVADEEAPVEDLEQERGQGQVKILRGENPP